MTRLYWSADHPSHWIGFTSESGYVIFPAEENGWRNRKPFLDPVIIREVPSRLAFNTGFPIPGVAGSSKNSAIAAQASKSTSSSTTTLFRRALAR